MRPALGRVGQKAQCAMSLAAAETHARVVSSRACLFRAPRRGRATGDAAGRLVPRVRGNRDGASATRTRPAAVPEPSPSGPPPLDLVVFTVIVDDLVFADGSTRMGVLGGGGPQTAFGFRTHPGNFSVGLAAGIGPDFPRECEDWLDANGVDSEGLMLVRDDDTDTCGAAEREGGGGEASASAFVARRERKKLDEKKDAPDARTFRDAAAWQITERDGRRTQVWRTPANAGLYAMLRPPWRRSRRDTEARGRSRRRKPRTPGRGAPRVSAADSRRRRRETRSVESSSMAQRRAVHARDAPGSAGNARGAAPPETSSPRTSWRLCPWWVRARRRSCAAASRRRRQNRVRAPRGEAPSRTTPRRARRGACLLFSVKTSLGRWRTSPDAGTRLWGFIAGLASGESLDRAACWGSAAASVVAEHVGARRARRRRGDEGRGEEALRSAPAANGEDRR